MPEVKAGRTVRLNRFPSRDPMPTTATSIPARAFTEKRPLAVWSDLFKARLTTLVLITTAVGFHLGSVGSLNLALLAHTLAGTALLAAGAAALNQLLERDHDAKMRRTQDRPLPSGRLRPESVLRVGVVSATLGLGWLALAVNALTAVLGATTVLLYLFLYTPLKRVTPLNTLVGAVPGALPPLMGWTAARGSLEAGGWSLFAILACWQVPHFLAIAWLYREDYARAGFAMLPVSDTEGRCTSGLALWHALGLVPVSLLPFALSQVGTSYLIGASGLGLMFAWTAFCFWRHVSPTTARRLFYVSILYLPLLLAFMVMDKLKG